MTEERTKENSGLVAITNMAIPIEFDTFCDALRLGGKLVLKNGFQKHENGNYFHVLDYKGTTYITTTDYPVMDFLI
ncbi:MAG: hypothetical protein ACPLXC_00080 [Candidatus Pacearchaeota archaeon]